MIINMHCRPISPPDYILTSSFLFPHSNSTLKCQESFPNTLRRLQDPVLTYASNYYVTNPHQIISHSPSVDQDIHRKNIYCDLCNLLERSTPIPTKKKPFFNYSKQTIVYENQGQSADHKDKTRRSRSNNTRGFRRILRNYFCLPMTIFNGK